MPLLLLLVTLLFPSPARAQDEPSPMSYDDFESIEVPPAEMERRRAKLRVQIDFAEEAVEAAPVSSYERIKRLLELAHLHHQIGRDAGSREDLQQAVALYRQVLEALPSDALRDHATFFLGFTLRSLDDPMAVVPLLEVAVQYPDSSFAPHAWLHVGEGLFEDGEYVAALDAYRRASGPAFELRGFAVYKEAWCSRRLDHPDAARDTMGRVVLDPSRPGLVRAAYEVLDYWTRQDTGSAPDAQYLAAVRRSLRQDTCLDELPALKAQLRQEPLAPDAPQTQLRVVACLADQGQLGPARTELRRLERTYDRKSRWADAQTRSARRHVRRIIKTARELVAKAAPAKR